MIVVIHKGLKCDYLGLYFLSFDYFKELNESRDDVLNELGGYWTECGIASKFEKEFPQYRYVSSNDLVHAYDINTDIIATLALSNKIKRVYEYNGNQFNRIK